MDFVNRKGHLVLSNEVCCRQITGELCDNPAFDKMTGLGWYDGATLGVVVCEKCLTEYHFFLIDWNNDRSMRVFALQELARGTTERLSKLIGDRPPGPFWFPQRLVIPTGEDGITIDDAIDRILVPTTPPSLVAAWPSHAYRPICARRLTNAVPSEMSYLLSIDTVRPEFDWLAYLGFTSEGTKGTER